MDMEEAGIFLYRKKRKRKKIRLPLSVILAGIIFLATLGYLVYLIPAVQDRLSWRIDSAYTYVRTIFSPVGFMPTPVTVADSPEGIFLSLTPQAPLGPATPTLQFAATAGSPVATVQAVTPTVVATATPEPLPARIELPPTTYEKQDWNACGPATLTMFMRFYGWKGSQADVLAKVKPDRRDRNVNVDELVGFVLSDVPNLKAVYRVGGNIDTLRRLLAAGFPVMVEESFVLVDKNYWPNDDHWTGHYLLLTGYDDATQNFYVSNSYAGPESDEIIINPTDAPHATAIPTPNLTNARPNPVKPYADLDKNWGGFNRVYIVIYTPDQSAKVAAILGANLDPDTNRQNALDLSLAETRANPENSFAWFNLGSNLTYFERYKEAATAYDTARKLGLPQRMLRYQFGPFMAYFHAGRNEDLMALTEYALNITPNSEEALLWRGWGLYRASQRGEALASFQEALKQRPAYQDALYALKYVMEN